MYEQLLKIHLLYTWHRRQSWGVGGRDPPRFCAGGSWGRKILLLSYHVQEVCSKVVTFEEK